MANIYGLTIVKSNMEEIWKDIKNYEGLYQISNKGKVKSLERKVKGKNGSYNTVKEKILKPGKNKIGYMIVVLSKDRKKKNYYLHRLVAEAFLNNPYNLQEINHLDEDKTNNNVNNLEWSTHIHNINFGTRTERTSKKIICIETGIEYQSIMEIQRKFGFNKSSISACCRGKIKTAGKLHWKYVD